MMRCLDDILMNTSIVVLGACAHTHTVYLFYNCAFPEMAALYIDFLARWFIAIAFYMEKGIFFGLVK